MFWNKVLNDLEPMDFKEHIPVSAIGVAAEKKPNNPNGWELA